jgi:hypothetical protein
MSLAGLNNPEQLAPPFRAVVRALRHRSVLNALGAFRLWYLEKSGELGVGCPFAFARALYKLRVTEKLARSLKGRCSQSDRIKQKIAKAWWRGAPSTAASTAAVLKQDKTF